MRYVCIHGHFYQPPRENPWLEIVELEDSAYPYHDWNERITAECYGPNAWSRILDARGRIIRIVNNYSWISFDFGPTLLRWLEQEAPEVYRAILAADREGCERFDGHGPAIAHPYHHTILPLADERDRRTELLWGLRDFECRFGRRPEGIWLPETAVDLATLELVAQLGISFTILAPHQAAAVRAPGFTQWEDVSGGRVDPTRPYRVTLPSGRTIVVFFYDGPISRDVAFGDLLNDGRQLAARLLAAASDTTDRLAHIATDGETYGHHHRFGDMALAAALAALHAERDTRVVTYGAYLAGHPATWEARIVEDTSWSCAHGIERWRSDCGCNTGAHPGWTQAWRGPLREALDWLRDTVARLYEEQLRPLLRDPWAARDDYIEVVLDRSPQNVERFLDRWQTRALEPEERVRVLEALEMQRLALRMYSSDAWFFDELSGLETVQALRTAARVIQLAEELFQTPLEADFVERLARAPSNLPQYGDGRGVWERLVRPARIDLANVAAHYSLSALFEDYPERTAIGCYEIERLDGTASRAGRAHLFVARVRVTSTYTGRSRTFVTAALHLGDHNLVGGVEPDGTPERYGQVRDVLQQPFARADLAETVRALDRVFGRAEYSLRSLFKDEQRKLLDIILNATLSQAEDLYRHLYEDSQPLMRFLLDLGVPIPRAFLTAAEVTVNAELRRQLSEPRPSFETLALLFDEAERWRLQLDHAGLAYTLQETMEALADEWNAHPDDQEVMDTLAGLARLAGHLSEPVNTWHVQNVAYELILREFPRWSWRAQQGDPAARAWVERFRALCDAYWLALDEIERSLTAA
ncbi:MAG: DUF3536 domain-containing protein [Thermomicrobium sp.]|nr:DUF3536 domain-containing protein [Thermomicrobium sp.]